MPAPRLLNEEDVVSVLRSRGGRAHLRDLTPELGVHSDTLRRYFSRLMSDGLVERAGRGEYQLTRRYLGLGPTAARLVEILETAGFDGHLTGFDLLVHHAHQFVFQFPHLVYADPTALESVEFELTANDYVVQRADASARVSLPETSQLVVLRKQPDPERYRVHGFIAPVEKAWVDALRESNRGTVPLQSMELGRILRSLVDGGADMRFLRHYARQLGYLNRVDAAMNGTDDTGELGALRAGYQA